MPMSNQTEFPCLLESNDKLVVWMDQGTLVVEANISDDASAIYLSRETARGLLLYLATLDKKWRQEEAAAQPAPAVEPAAASPVFASELREFWGRVFAGLVAKGEMEIKACAVMADKSLLAYVRRFKEMENV